MTEAGIAQAELLVDDLAQTEPSLIASSPYLRAVQTVEPTARAVGMPVHTEHDLREWDSGLKQPLTTLVTTPGVGPTRASPGQAGSLQ
ncbi:MAG TPA: histidine phosphatase family protein [Pseudonocardiaceae bacterium]|nr:histidine phosphatase family protein [Pseudonocardiaceae bacterium]